MSLPPPTLPGTGDPRVLARARMLHLRARQAVAGLHHGAHASVRLGHDAEFVDHAPYQPGDALRDVDWRVLGRSDRLVVRRRRAERVLSGTVVLDASADLGSTPGKWDHAVGLAATLAWFLHTVGEPVGLEVAAGEGVAVRRLPARGGSRHAALVLRTLAAVRPAGRASLDGTFRAIGGRLGARSLVAVVGDFMEEPDEWRAAVHALVRNRVDLRALHVTDPEELGLAFDAPLRVRSPESGEERPLDPDAARTPFAAEVQRWRGEVRSALRAARGVVLDAPVGAPLVDLLAAFAWGGGGHPLRNASPAGRSA
ncbi:MAG: hypothetical protein RLZZ299_805 [Pseudomonadota bacterium]|jgi:uncharacterized protein (DUF58 family)